MKKTILLLLWIVALHPCGAQTFTSSNLPVIIINTNGRQILDDPKISANMGIIWNAGNAVNNVTDSFNHYNGKIGIELRGQSSQMFPMKSYGFELRNSSDNSINKSLFGLPAESDWILYAPYNEKTLLHNFLAYTMSREMGHWAANCRYVEVVINGVYQGVYVFMEKIKRKAGRVNISALSSTDNSGDAVTGGYIFSIDKDANAWFSQYPADRGRIQYSYVYPKEVNITSAQKNYIQQYTDSFEAVLHGSQYQDKQNGWRNFADENSFIDYFIVNEVSRNVDGYRISTFLNKDRYSNGGKINAGPVWDYDLAFKNANYCNGSNIDGWSYQFNSVCADDFWQVPDWWKIMMTDTAFKNNLRCRWRQLRAGSLSSSHLHYLVDSIVSLTAEARQRHFQRWPVLGQYLWPNPEPVPATYEGEISALKNWLEARLTWLDNNIPNTGVCAIFPADVQASLVISAFPNPYSDNYNIKIVSKTSQTVGLKITDMSGRAMQRSFISLAAGNNAVSLQSGYWATGIYLVEFTTTSGEKIARKILMQ